jgi:GT2 family glycosyltransferase
MSGGQKRVAVVVLNWNGAAELIPHYLPPLLDHTDPVLADVIEADNGSTDGSLDLIKEKYPAATALPLGSNLGFAAGYNKALRLLDGYEYVCLLNDDVLVTPGWLEPLVRFLDDHPEVVSVQPTIRSERQPEELEYAGALGGYVDRLGYPFCRGRIFSTLEEDRGQYGTDPMPVFWTSGACMLCRREAFLTAGGLDESFVAHQEEIDLCWRWAALGYDLYVVPESVVYHWGGKSLSADDPRKTFLNFRNNILMLRKNLPERLLRPTLRRRQFLDRVARAYFRLSGHSGDAAAVTKALRELRSRAVTRSEGDLERAYSRLYPKSILLEYHLRGHHTYDKLS